MVPAMIATASPFRPLKNGGCPPFDRELVETPISYIANPVFEIWFRDSKVLRTELLVDDTSFHEDSGIDDPSATTLSKMVRHRILTEPEERSLFLSMNYAKYLAERLRSSILSACGKVGQHDELAALIHRANVIRNLILQVNLRLVVSEANMFVSRFVEFDDLVSEGALLLARVIDLFDVSRGYRFSTYAIRALKNRFVRIQTQERSKRAGLVSAANADAEEIEDDRTLPPQLITELRSVHETLNKLLDSLPARDREIVTMRFGFDGVDRGLSFHKIGRRLGLSKERVRQLYHRIVMELHESLSHLVEPENTGHVSALKAITTNDPNL